jgi:hypothetical protein
MRLASPLLTSLPGTRVLDVLVHIGGHHLPRPKVHHQLTLAGIAGATRLADPEKLDLPRRPGGARHAPDRGRSPRYLTGRGYLHPPKWSCPWPSAIPARPQFHGRVTRSHRFSPCDDPSPKHDLLLLADSNECLTQGLRKRTDLSSPLRKHRLARPLPARACFHSRCLRSVSLGRRQARGCREYCFSVIVVWCRLVVRQSG